MYWVILASTFVLVSIAGPTQSPIDQINDALIESMTGDTTTTWYDELQETLGDWYFQRVKSLWHVKRSSTGMSKKDGFSCAGLIKAYGILRGIRTLADAKMYNSAGLFDLWKEKSLTRAKRFDYVQFRHIRNNENWYNMWHAAIVYAPYDPKTGILQIYDNVDGIGKPRPMKLYKAWGEWIYDIGTTKRSVHVASNPLVDLAYEQWLVYKPTKEYIGTFLMTRYYAPVSGQQSYLAWSYEKEKIINCWPGDCLVPSKRMVYKPSDAGKYMACPPWLPFETYAVDGIGDVKCVDRWWSIKNKRIDLWIGIWDQWYDNLHNWKYPPAYRKLYKYNWFTTWPIETKKI